MDPDLALLRITGSINNSWEVFFAGWNRNDSSPASTSVGIHHPGGRPKILSTTTGTGYIQLGMEKEVPLHMALI